MSFWSLVVETTRWAVSQQATFHLVVETSHRGVFQQATFQPEKTFQRNASTTLVIGKDFNYQLLITNYQ